MNIIFISDIFSQFIQTSNSQDIRLFFIVTIYCNISGLNHNQKRLNQLSINSMQTRSFFIKIIIPIIISFFSTIIYGQVQDSVSVGDSLPTQLLEEVVVSAKRYSSFSLKTPDPIRVLSAKTYERLQLRTSPEALLATPGVFVQKTNHGGGSPFLRGLTGNQTLLMIDGIRLNNATARYGPNQYFNTLDVFSIEKIELLRGSGSVQYGSDAMGGTIHAFSHELMASERPEFGSTLLTRIATSGMEQSLHGSANYSNTKVALRGGITLRNFGDIVGGDTTGRQTPTGYKEIDFDLKGKIFFSPATDLTISYQNVHQMDVPVYHKITLENYAVYKMDPQDRGLGYLRLKHKFDNGILKSAIVTASMQNSFEGREMHKIGSYINRLENDKVRSFGLSAEALISSGKNWSSNNGIEFYNDLVNSTRKDTDMSSGISVEKRGLYPDGATMNSIALFTIHTFDLTDWNISAGGRFNTFIIIVSDPVSGQTKLTPSSVTGNLAILRKLNKNSNLFISGSSGFRAPNIDDLGSLGIVDFRYEIPNYDLKPEHSFQYQVGYKYQNKNLRGEVYLYRNELYNLIVRNKMAGDSLEGYPVYIKENVERAYIQGIETAWDWDLNESFAITGSITYTYGQNITKNEPARRIPPIFGRAALEYSLKNWWISLEYQGAGKQDRLAAGDKEDNRIPPGGTPGWNILNIYSGINMKYVNVGLSFLNLFNVDYRFHGSGINSYGRSAFLTVTVSI